MIGGCLNIYLSGAYSFLVLSAKHAPEHMRNKNRQNAFQRHFLHPSPKNVKKKKSLKIKDFLPVAPI